MRQDLKEGAGHKDQLRSVQPAQILQYNRSTKVVQTALVRTQKDSLVCSEALQYVVEWGEIENFWITDR